MKITLPPGSTEYLRCLVAATADPADATVSFALTTTTATPETWQSGEWEDDAEVTDGVYRRTARVLVGPAGTIQPAAGTHHLWIRVTAAPEVVVRRVGTVTTS